MCFVQSLLLVVSFATTSLLYLCINLNGESTSGEGNQKQDKKDRQWNDDGKKGALREVGAFVRHVEKLQWLAFSFFITITLVVLRIIFTGDSTQINSFLYKQISFGFLFIWYVLLPVGYTKLNNSAYAMANKLEDHRMDGFPSNDFLYAHEIDGMRKHLNSPLDVSFWGFCILFIVIFSSTLCVKFGYSVFC